MEDGFCLCTVLVRKIFGGKAIDVSVCIFAYFKVAIPCVLKYGKNFFKSMTNSCHEMYEWTFQKWAWFYLSPTKSSSVVNVIR